MKWINGTTYFATAVSYTQEMFMKLITGVDHVWQQDPEGYQAGFDAIKRFYLFSPLTVRQNELECLPPTSFSG
jgi:hypothetical protein